MLLTGNSYGDHEALIVARHLQSLESLVISYGKLSWEGIGAVSSSLTGLNSLDISNQMAVAQGFSFVGRLPHISKLFICNCELMQTTSELWSALPFRLPSN